MEQHNNGHKSHYVCKLPPLKIGNTTLKFQKYETRAHNNDVVFHSGDDVGPGGVLTPAIYCLAE